MTEVTGVVIRHEDVEADLAWLRDYSQQVKDITARAQRGSMEAAARMTRVYEAREWVKDLPPVRVAHRMGTPIKADSQARFAQWVKDHPEKIGDVYSPSRVSGLLTAHRVASDFSIGPMIKSDDAIDPLRRFVKDRRAEIPDIIRRAREISDGGTITAGVIKQAIHDHQQSIIPPKVADSGKRAQVDHAAIIRAEFRIILNSKRFRDAGALLNELRAELMTAAGVTE
jgi:hypothetical protein